MLNKLVLNLLICMVQRLAALVLHPSSPSPTYLIFLIQNQQRNVVVTGLPETDDDETLLTKFCEENLQLVQLVLFAHLQLDSRID